MEATRWLEDKVLSRLREAAGRSSHGRRTLPGGAVDEVPLRAELFTADQMEQHGKEVAAAHELTLKRSPDRLLPRLAANEKKLAEVGTLLAQTGSGQRRVTPAGEWLLDNFHLIEEEIRTAKRHLPPGYSRELPRLASGANAGFPRVYDLALHAVAHGDGQLGRGSLIRFITAYQSVKLLQLGELWAIPIMLRLALIENLRRVAARVAASRIDRDVAGLWADQMLDVAERDPKGLILVLADMARSDPPMTAPFVSEIARILHGRSAALSLPLSWVEQRLGENHQTIEQLVQLEGQRQAAAQVSVSNSIGSLRLLGAMPWREFVESLSKIEQTLRDDPAGVYSKMDFITRDTYRRSVERIARHSALTEPDVALAAIELARAAVGRREPDAAQCEHVGYYLVDSGRADLERMARLRVGPWQRLRRRVSRRPLAWHGGSIALLTLALAIVPLYAAPQGLTAPLALPREPWLAFAVLLLLIAASQLAVSLVNWLSTMLSEPMTLPRMDFSSGIPPEARTLVVVPTLLGSQQAADELVEALEVRFLGNRDAQLRYALLTDFRDAPEATSPADAATLDRARSGIEALNCKHGERFFLLHRPRLWNPREGVWMGRERKRGKLADLNALLRGKGSQRFLLVVGDTSQLAGVRYVITLDTDTQLPRDAARQLVAAMAHPLNRPHFGGPAGAPRVVRGYGILQPRVTISLPEAGRTRYGRLFAGEPGIDPYTRAVSDVYQDLFGEGSFIGKGIYDVDAFEHVLRDRLPENRILSHDLLEGGYARSGLLSDVELVEGSPSRYDEDVRRRHRWMRGDWQIIGWLLPGLRMTAGEAGIPSADPARAVVVRNPLSALSRWKIFDNLRRSLVPPALAALLLLGWTVLLQPALWTVACLAVLYAPPLIGFFVQLLRKPDELDYRQHVAATAPSAVSHVSQATLALATLPYEAFFNVGAILRTQWRLWISRRRLLEWQPSSDAGRSSDADAPAADLVATFRRMWIAPTVAAATLAGLARLRPDAVGSALPVLVLWLTSPAIVWWLNRPRKRHQSALSAAQTVQLRMLARRTWAFFEAFVGARDNHLPPDNVQEHPVPRVAHRTSPTNIGLSLLASLSARDFGYITEGQLIERTAATLDTLDRLEKYRGHWLNWYDTRTLQPLRPAYVSSVDSGNLAGHLLTLQAGLRLLAGQPPQLDLILAGLQDTLRLLQLATGRVPADSAIARFASLLATYAAPAPQLPHDLCKALSTLLRGAQDIPASAPAEDGFAPADDAEVGPGSGAEADRWARALVRQCEAALADLQLLCPDAAIFAEAGWETPVLSARGSALQSLALRAGAMAEMDYGFLYDTARDLLAIGYNVDDRRLDTGRYDLLASEIRLASFVGIAKAQLPQETWFALGRQLTVADGGPVLLSWSGSMFEYLMPMLVMPSYEDTLLDQTMRGAVARQIHYGRQRGVPWGISESGYNATDAQLNYQYRAFGVPGLGLKRGLAEDLVVAPYATVMALMVAPEAAMQNLQRLADAGVAGAFGYYEAVDYTPSRQLRGNSSAIVRSYMAHHLGMSLLALVYVLLDRPMQRRFESDPELRATLLLLHERVPKSVAFHQPMAERAEIRSGQPSGETPVRVVTSPDTTAPEVQLLSNGSYHVMLTSSGGGYSRWKDIAVSRWAEDGTADASGSFCYLRDIETGTFWSTTHQPTHWKSDSYEAIFSEGRAEFRRRDQGIDAYTEVAVSPEDDVELRRLRLTNRSSVRRSIEVTSYCEVVLATAASDAQHPAFSKLFVQTEVIEDPALIVCTRRPRGADEQPPWMFHLIAVHGATAGPASHETDRARFIGRGRSLHAPSAMRDAGPLSGTCGPVLDPIVATRRVITLDSEQTAVIDIVCGVAATREGILELAHKYTDRRLAERVFELAWTHGQVRLRQLNVTDVESALFARLANTVVHSQPTLRADTAVLLRNRRGQSGLWGYAISGDLPIVLLQVSDASNIDLVRQMVQAHAYWRLKGLAVDLVVWNEERDVYRQRLQEQILGLIAGSSEPHVVDRPGGIFVRHAEQIAVEDRVLLQSVARAIISDRRGSLAEQVQRGQSLERRVADLVPTRVAEPSAPVAVHPSMHDLLLFNGIGGFSPDGREYVISTTPDRRPPAPWANVIANPRFGTVVSDAGSSYTWCENAHELRLTPWHNDPVSDSSGEAIYLRDEETGQVWHPTSLPAPGDLRDESAATPYITRHGFGYSVFEHAEAAIHSELTVFVAIDAAVKFSRLRLRNDGARPRLLSATGYVEWVLGDTRAKTAPHIHTDQVAGGGAIYARNRYSNDFGDWIGFFDVDESDRLFGSITCDRAEFIGRNGSMRQPAALRRLRLSGRTGVALDPCAAIQVLFELAPGQTREVIFRLGMGRSEDEAGQLVRRFRGRAAARQALAEVNAHWQEVLGAVQVSTPDAALDILSNGWLVYQTLACRMWARSGYYQSGGAYGFRDQLQDAMALVHTQPQALRDHLLFSASRQFVEGDVQHWWHPPSGRGVRTHISDDFLWLPLALCRYVRATNDTGILNEKVAFLDGPAVASDAESYYDLPGRSAQSESLYRHASLAVQHGLRFGAHGLPLMGAGDWNDGMNQVGHQGRGESVWLGFFLCEVLREFAALALRHGDEAFAGRCESEREQLGARLEAVAWDGDWYRRAYFDDGTPLGSKDNAECRIDSIAQSWAVLSGIGSAQRVARAMDSVAGHLVRAESGLVQLLDPPFDRKGPNPGYIAGYLPGVRENGGQYTHSAVWVAMAYATLGDAERAWQVMDLINPLHHGRTAEEVAIYKVEPYVVAADVYSVPPHTGRGGWSWYTGSAGWMYRLIVESLLGLRLQVDDAGASLSIQPCVPSGWTGYRVDYRFRRTMYRIDVKPGAADRPGPGPAISVNDAPLRGNRIELVDDGGAHAVVVLM